jgi:hypothetical protein
MFLWGKENGFSEWRLELLADGAIELQGQRRLRENCTAVGVFLGGKNLV